MIDLKQEHLKIVQEILVRRVPDVEVWAFGSRVKGKARPHSDLDLAIVGAATLPGMLKADLKEDFSESDLPFRVDIIDWHSVSQLFREIIQNEHVVLQPTGGKS